MSLLIFVAAQLVYMILFAVNAALALAAGRTGLDVCAAALIWTLLEGIACNVLVLLFLVLQHYCSDNTLRALHACLLRCTQSRPIMIPQNDDLV